MNPEGRDPGDRSAQRGRQNRGAKARGWDFAVLAVLLVNATATLAILSIQDGGGFTEEAVPFRQALMLWGWGDRPPTANPRFFSYPSLSIYWSWLLQWCTAGIGLATGRYGDWADAGVEFVLAPRFLVLGARVGSAGLVVLAAWCAYRWVGRESRIFGALAALSVSLSPALFRVVAELPPECLMAWLGLAGLGALRAARGQRTSRPWLVGVAAGALCGTKYSAIPYLLFAVAAVGLHDRRHPGRVRSPLVVLLVAVGTFLLTTPFALLSPGEFWRDVTFELAHLAGGHLGGAGHFAARAHAAQLLAAHGPGFLACLPGYLFVRSLRPKGAGLLLGGACAFLVPAMLSRSGGPERYIVPAIPMLMVFTWEVTRAALRSPTRRLRWLGATLLVLGVLPSGSAAWSHARSIAPSAVACASHWVVTHTQPTDVIAQDAGSLAVYSVEDQDALLRSNCLAMASEPWRRAAASTVPRTLVTVPFVASGTLFAEVRDASGSRRRIVLFDPAWKFVPAMYRAMEEVGVRYVVRNSSVRNRLGASLGPLADRGHWPPKDGPVLEQCRGPAGGIRNASEITVCAGGRSPRETGAPGPEWWLGESRPPGASGSDVDSSMYRIAVSRVYEERVRPYLSSLAQGALRQGDSEALVRAARLLLVSRPDDILATRFAVLGLSVSRADSVWDRAGLRRLRRRSDESSEAWVTRVLSEWGVDRGRAELEVRRFEALRPSAP